MHKRGGRGMSGHMQSLSYLTRMRMTRAACSTTNFTAGPPLASTKPPPSSLHSTTDLHCPQQAASTDPPRLHSHQRQRTGSCPSTTTHAVCLVTICVNSGGPRSAGKVSALPRYGVSDWFGLFVPQNVVVIRADKGSKNQERRALFIRAQSGVVPAAHHFICSLKMRYSNAKHTPLLTLSRRGRMPLPVMSTLPSDRSNPYPHPHTLLGPPGHTSVLAGAKYSANPSRQHEASAPSLNLVTQMNGVDAEQWRRCKPQAGERECMTEYRLIRTICRRDEGSYDAQE